jgi:hypothetical protein
MLSISYISYHVDSLAAALSELGITSVSAIELLEAVKQQENRKQREWPRSTCEHFLESRHYPAVTFNSIVPDQGVPVGLSCTPRFHATSEPLDEVAKERRRRLRKLALDAFPDGKIPEPYC